jgi:hypothetical protein
MVMGTFEVTETLRTGYRAKCKGMIDPLWLGYLHRVNLPEVPAAPDTAAILLEACA